MYSVYMCVSCVRCKQMCHGLQVHPGEPGGPVQAVQGVHTRSAERMLGIYLSSGGLHIKFGQGLVTHGVLLREYYDELRVGRGSQGAVQGPRGGA